MSALLATTAAAVDKSRAYNIMVMSHHDVLNRLALQDPDPTRNYFVLVNSRYIRMIILIPMRAGMAIS